MKRRRFLLGTGAAGLLLGAEAGRRAWRELARGPDAATALAPRHATLIASLADTILPRTHTPGAVDVGVPGWIAILVTQAYPESDRRAFLDGLEAMDRASMTSFGRPLAEIEPDERDRLIDAWDRPDRILRLTLRLQGALARRLSGDSFLHPAVTRVAQAPRAFLTLKALVVHGYFTSEVVQRDVMRVQWA